MDLEQDTPPAIESAPTDGTTEPEISKPVVSDPVPMEEDKPIEQDTPSTTFNCPGCGADIPFEELAQYLHGEFIEKTKSFLAIECPKSKCSYIYTEADYRKLLSQEDAKIFEEYLNTIPDVATHLKDFQYSYNDKGELRNIQNGRQFHWVSQPHYDALGDFVYKYIQELMVANFHFKEVWLPVEAPEDSPRCNIFLSPDALTNTEKLLLIIQGSGAVRPGQWARALCINATLDMGTIFPYIEKALADGYGIIVFNPNENSVSTDVEHDKELLTKKAFLTVKKPGPSSFNPLMKLKRKKIPDNESPPEHVIYVYDQFVKDSPAKKLAIVAHSAGGSCTMELLRHRNDIMKKLKVIAFTDSVHSVSYRESKEVLQFIKSNAINWVQSDKPLDTAMKNVRSSSGCPEVSAGHEKHEWTSGCSVESVFVFLKKKMEQETAEPTAEGSCGI